MRPVRRVVGRGLPLARSDVDTDQIIASEHLKRVDRSGYGDALFAAWRRDPAFVLNDARYRGATILVAGPNFGCGSSREHAVWAIRDAGFEAVIAPSFADIFRANCVRNGLVPATVAAPFADRLAGSLQGDPALEIAVDVEAREVSAYGLRVPFELADHARRQLLLGLDDIGLALAHADAIAAYESRRPAWLPRVG